MSHTFRNSCNGHPNVADVKRSDRRIWQDRGGGARLAVHCAERVQKSLTVAFYESGDRCFDDSEHTHTHKPIHTQGLLTPSF